MPTENNAPKVETLAIETTAKLDLTVWSDALGNMIKDKVANGERVGKALSKLCPKGFLSQARQTRKLTLIANTSVIVGQLTAKNAKVTNQKEVTVKRDGTRSQWIEFSELPRTEADDLRDENAKLKAQLAQLSAKAGK